METGPVRVWAVVVTSIVLAGCSASGAEGPEGRADCSVLLDGRGFADHILVKQEPVTSQPGRFYCVFVEERYRDERPTVQVPARQVLYKSEEDSYTEAPTTIPVTQDFSKAPAAR